ILVERPGHMSKLKLSIAIGNYDRARPLFDGTVQIDGVDPVFMQLPPEEIFFRAFRTIDFDICELSMSSFTVKTAIGDCPYVGVPALSPAPFGTIPSMCGLTASRRRRTSKASASACRNISSP